MISKFVKYVQAQFFWPYFQLTNNTKNLTISKFCLYNKFIIGLLAICAPRYWWDLVEFVWREYICALMHHDFSPWGLLNSMCIVRQSALIRVSSKAYNWQFIAFIFLWLTLCFAGKIVSYIGSMLVSQMYWCQSILMVCVMFLSLSMRERVEWL